MLYTMDGNDSLKQIQRREVIPVSESVDDNSNGPPVLGNSSESMDNCEAGKGIYLTNDLVNQWSKEILAQLCPTYSEDETDNHPCAERWWNMRTAITARMWGIFEETGLFLALCRHGFVLMLADMIRSGELYVFYSCVIMWLVKLTIINRSKYPLAILNKMLRVFGKDLAAGYDIACRFGITVDHSPLGEMARENNHRCLVGAFHGHAHCT